MLKNIHPNQPEIEVVCRRGARIQGITSFLENFSLQNLRPDVFIIHAGTNNINAKMSGYSCRKEMQALCELALKTCPSTRIFLSGVISRTVGSWERKQSEVDDLNKRISHLNEEFKSFCVRHGYRFIDNSYITADCLHRDGLHLNPIGDERLSSSLFSCFLDNVSESFQDQRFSLLDDFPPLPSKSNFCSSTSVCQSAVKGKINLFPSHQSVGESNKKAELLKNLRKKYVVKKSHKGYLYRKPLIKNFSKKHQPSSYSGQLQHTSSSNSFYAGIGELSENPFFALSVETESVETESEFEVETDVNTVCFKTSATKNRKRSHQMKKKPKKSTVKEQSSDFLRDIPFDSNRIVTVEVKCSHDDVNLKTDNDEAKCLHNEMSLKSDKEQMNIPLTEKETSKRKQSHLVKKNQRNQL